MSSWSTRGSASSYKCCGDGFAAALLLETLGLEPSSVLSWRPVDTAWVRSLPGGRWLLLLPHEQGQFAVVAPRAELDAAGGVARHAGVKVHDGHGFTGILTARLAWLVIEVDALGPAVEARYVIAADGMWSPVRKAPGCAEQGYWKSGTPSASTWRGHRHARDRLGSGSTDLLPGYAWSFPLPDGRANVGFGVLRDGGRRIQDIKGLWPELLDGRHVREALGPGARPSAPHKAWPIPARIDRAVLPKDGPSSSATPTGVRPARGEGIDRRCSPERCGAGRRRGGRHPPRDGRGSGTGARGA